MVNDIAERRFSGGVDLVLSSDHVSFESCRGTRPRVGRARRAGVPPLVKKQGSGPAKSARGDQYENQTLLRPDFDPVIGEERRLAGLSRRRRLLESVVCAAPQP